MGEKDLKKLKELLMRSEEEWKRGETLKHFKTLQLIGEHVYLIAGMEGLLIHNTDTGYNDLVEV